MAESWNQQAASGLRVLIGFGNEEVLPLILLKNDIAIAAIPKTLMNFGGQARHGIKIKFDGLMLTNQGLKPALPAACQDADFRKIPVRDRID
jgi:hypothetical protein